jgi:hypothetical protein
MEKLKLTPLKNPPPTTPYGANDYLVVFGEVFAKGYVNGLLEAAQKRGMKIILTTVGRRDADNQLRALSQDETVAASHGFPLINIPLEAGFDLTPDSAGGTPADQLQGIKISEWPQAKVNWQRVEESRVKARSDFAKRVAQFVEKLEPMIPASANVVFAHTMAGGVPRAKIYMPAMNRVFKGRGDRYESSQKFTECDIGQLALKNFEFVTADTFDVLIKATEKLRARQTAQGKNVSYLAYGYHGTEVFYGGKYQWQTYTCYFQGWAKMRLEDYARQAFAQGIPACVFNCPEILTNSSSVFQGVEVSLYPLLAALRQHATAAPALRDVLNQCANLLKPEFTLDAVIARTEEYLTSKLAAEFNDYPNWPLHNRSDQMEWMLSSSDALIGMHRDEKNLLTLPLSEQIFRGTGYLMLDEISQLREPVWWLGHDVISAKLAQLH